MICFNRKTKVLCGQLRLQSETDTTLSVAGTYYKIAGDFNEGDCPDFSVVDDNKLKYNGPSGVLFVLNGTSDAQVDKASEITYASYMNGSLVPGSLAIHMYLANSKTSSLAITALIELNKNDVLEVYAKSTVSTTKLTVRTLHVTLFGVK